MLLCFLLLLHIIQEYIRHHQLHDEYDETLVNCDATLQALFERQSVPLRALEVELDRHLFPAQQGPLRFKVPLPPVDVVALVGSSGGGGSGGGGGGGNTAPKSDGRFARHESVWHVGFDRLVPSAQTRAVRASLRRLDLLDDKRVYAGLLEEYYREQQQQGHGSVGSAQLQPTAPARSGRRLSTSTGASAQADHGNDNDGGSEDDDSLAALQPATLTPRAADHLAAAQCRFMTGLRRGQRVASAAAAINREVRDLAFVRLLCQSDDHHSTAAPVAPSNITRAKSSQHNKRKAALGPSTAQASPASSPYHHHYHHLGGGVAAATGRLLDTMHTDLAALHASVTPTLESDGEFTRSWVGPVVDYLAPGTMQ